GEAAPRCATAVESSVGTPVPDATRVPPTKIARLAPDRVIAMWVNSVELIEPLQVRSLNTFVLNRTSDVLTKSCRPLAVLCPLLNTDFAPLAAGRNQPSMQKSSSSNRRSGVSAVRMSELVLGNSPLEPPNFEYSVSICADPDCDQ